MLFEESELTGSQLLQEKRCQSFASMAANRIQAVENCLFSFLPREELARLAAGWYEACSQAMLRGNFAAIEQWVRCQSMRAAKEGFALEDVVELLRICRISAFETEQWNEDIFSQVEEVIKEVLGTTTDWSGPAEHNLVALEAGDSEASVLHFESDNVSSERRNFGRNRLQFPIRVCSTIGQWRAEEITVTKNISRGGLYFVTEGCYQAEQDLKVSYPYWTDPGAINPEYSAKVVRIDRLSDKTCGVAVHFWESHGRRSG
jgi:hypothetical protein